MGWLLWQDALSPHWGPLARDSSAASTLGGVIAQIGTNRPAGDFAKAGTTRRQWQHVAMIASAIERATRAVTVAPTGSCKKSPKNPRQIFDRRPFVAYIHLGSNRRPFCCPCAPTSRIDRLCRRELPTHGRTSILCRIGPTSVLDF